MTFEYDPFREMILRRSWDGVEETEHHMAVGAPSGEPSVFCPATMFGSEAFMERR